eukprot:scaffold275810_cov24-Tisochrysis_lutea.AAC.2
MQSTRSGIVCIHQVRHPSTYVTFIKLGIRALALHSSRLCLQFHQVRHCLHPSSQACEHSSQIQPDNTKEVHALSAGASQQEASEHARQIQLDNTSASMRVRAGAHQHKALKHFRQKSLSGVQSTWSMHLSVAPHIGAAHFHPLPPDPCCKKKDVSALGSSTACIALGPGFLQSCALAH